MDTSLRKNPFWEKGLSWGRGSLAGFLRDGRPAAPTPRKEPTWLRRFPGFFAAQAVLLAATVSASAWTLHRYGKRVAAGRQLAALEREFAALTGTGTLEDADRIEAEAARLEQEVNERRVALAGDTSVEVVEIPSGRADAFFALARFVEQQRRQAAAAGVRCREDERFGFAAYAQAGPEPEEIPFVHRQRRGAQRLLDAVWCARPARFDGLEREPPPRAASMADGDRVAADYFEPTLSLWRPDALGSLAFRLKFSGQTAALRSFLNRLADSSPDMLVRLIEVEPVRDEPARDEAAVVEAGFSQFAVTVEWVGRSGLAEGIP